VEKYDDGSESEVTVWKRTANLSPDEILANFRNSFYPRIAVTVDMISTGTDVKPIECVFFLRNVKSAGFFEQMKGRGVRVILPDKLRTVKPSAKVKDRFIIVDAVGVCEQDKTESHTLNRQPSKILEQVLEYVAQGGRDSDALTTLAGRLARLQREFTPVQLAELRDLVDGKSFPNLAHGLLNACDPDTQIESAKQRFNVSEPSEEQITQAAEQLAQAAATPAAFRRRILEIRQQNEQTIDRHTIDDVLYAGSDASAVAKAQAEHLGTSLAIAPENFETGWFGQHGSLGRAHALFGAKLSPLMTELNERLAMTFFAAFVSQNYDTSGARVIPV
jgi:type I restriction enzyme, R subunit